MKKLIPFLLAIALLSSSCEYSELTVTSDLNIDKTYEVNRTGPYSETASVSYNDVLNNLDIPSNVRIDEVNIESVSVKVVVLADNQATAITISGKLQLGSSSPDVFKNFVAPLVGVNTPFIGLNSLIDDGVAGLKSKLQAYLKAQDFSPFNIDLSGNSSPIGGQKIHIQILLKILGSVKYTKCVNLPFILGGENCSL